MLRIGTDVVDISEVAQSLQRFGDRYARRVFTEGELGSWRRGDVTAAADLAERFAAKEAAIKVLAPGERGLDWRSVEVSRDQRGGCALSLSGTAAALAHEAGADQLSLSISSAGGLAMAVVVASSGRRRTGIGTAGTGTAAPGGGKA